MSSHREWQFSSIRARVIVVVLAVAIPLNALIFGSLWLLAEKQEAAHLQGLLYTSKTVTAAVDAQLSKYIALAEALSRSPSLLADDLTAFDAEARRAFLSISDAWVLVAQPNGQQLLNIARPPGNLPMRPSEAVEAQRRAFALGQMVIADGRIPAPVPGRDAATPGWVASIEFPIFRDGLPFRSLAVTVHPRGFLKLLSAERLPPGTSASIVDRHGQFIARVPLHEQYVGRIASDGFRKTLEQPGINEFITPSGNAVVTATTRSETSGWTVAVSIRKAELQGAVWHALRWAAALAGIISALSLFLAILIGRTIARPIRILREGSLSLIGGGSRLLNRGPSEILALQDAMQQAVAEQKRAQEELQSSESRYRASFDVSMVGKMEVDARTGRFLLVNDAYCSIVGWPREELLSMTPADLIHPDDRSWDGPAVAAFFRGETDNYSGEKRFIRKDGNIVWVRVNCSLVRDAKGRPKHSVGVLDDITGRKKHEEQIELLMREVNHRSKNLLSVVQAIANHTASKDPDEFTERFSQRLQALSANQDLLVRNDWKGIDVQELARAQIGHFADAIGTRVDLQGPRLQLNPAAAQAIGLALHELATNAVKHGALSNKTGIVTFAWAVEGDSLHLSWTESGGPRSQPNKHRGFGSIIISQMTKNALDGKVEYEHAPEGTRWTVVCPLQNVTNRPVVNAKTVALAEIRLVAEQKEENRTLAAAPN